MPITAQEIVNRIQTNLGVPWKASSSDGFQGGTPETAVTGIAMSFAPTLDVLRRAIAGHRNMIITREPALYRTGGPPRGGPPMTGPQLAELAAKDTTIRLKRDFIAENKLTVFRFSENWQARQPDGQLRGLAAALGWTKYLQPGGDFVLPATSLGALSRNVQNSLKITGTRVIGDPETRIRRVALTHGMIRVPDVQRILKDASVDAIVIGEPVEWEASPYFQDVIASGQKKGMIIIGQAASEDPGSGEVAAWLKTFISEVPIEWIPAGEPFWVPK